MNFISNKSLNHGTFSRFKRFFTPYRTRDMKIQNFLSRNRQKNRLLLLSLFVTDVRRSNCLQLTALYTLIILIGLNERVSRKVVFHIIKHWVLQHLPWEHTVAASVATEFCENFSRKRKRNFGSLLSDAYNFNIDTYVCNVDLMWNTVFCLLKS